ncbi:galactitol-1-phosphate 5-dehydrogenase [Lachnospiraceae bacterium]|nr:galactitol-1-phosphate 5-dehydrogenase [Lachnospiraceae bacterium]
MKAYILSDIGDIRLKDVGCPVPEENEVIIKVRASGICGSDIPRIFQNGAHKMPLIPGHEFSGEVVELGKETDKRLLHKRVGVFPLIPCRECMPCRKGEYEICRNYSYLGSRRDGGFAEYAAVPAANLMELPDTVSFEEAAMLEPMAVAVHAMRRAIPCKEGQVAVCGLGTIGLLLVMILKEAGFKNIAVIGNKDSQKEAALKMGIGEECYFDNRKREEGQRFMEHTKGAGADTFFECVGKNETVLQAVNLTAVSGKVCLVGNPFSDIKLSRDTYWKILRNQLTVTGTWNSAFTGKADDDWHYVLERLSEKKLIPGKLISHRFLMEELEAGFRIMRNKAEDYIKIMGVF